MLYEYECVETCERGDIPGRARIRFNEGDVFQVPEKIDSPRFRLVRELADPPRPKEERPDPAVVALNKKIAQDRKRAERAAKEAKE